MLTTADVTNKTFSTTRMREGYEIAEVDRFVADVAQALADRDEEIGELREKLAAAHDHTENGHANGNENGHRDGPLGNLAAFAAATGQHFAPVPVDGDLIRTNSVAAVRLLEIATANAEQVVSEAQVEAASLVTAARASSDQLLAAARDEAERLGAELTEREQEQTEELDRHRRAVLQDVADRKAVLEAKIEELAQLEEGNRTWLRGYFTEQLDRLDEISAGVGPESADDN